MKSLLIVFAITLTAAPAAIGSPQETRSAFEVATIKPNAEGFIDIGGGARILSGQTRCRGIDTRAISGDPLPVTPMGRCVVRNSTLKEMLNSAYSLRFGPARATLNQLVVGGPSWAETTTFDIEAKAEDPLTATSEQLLTMFQTLLSDRFKLKFHRENREVSGFSLVVGRNGSKLLEAKPEEQSAFTAAANVRGQKVPVATIANLLSQRLGGVVIDQTGLTGLYDFTLTWVPNETELGPNGLPMSRPPADQAGPSLPTALEEQLGLRLEAQRVSMEVVVIDSATVPSAN